MLLLACGVLAAACGGGEDALEATPPEITPGPRARLNVLFIAVDDLRSELGCFGAERALTPNIDALARAGVRFERAYCQQALCNPSRASLLTGCRPMTTRVAGLDEHFRRALPDVVTLPQYFKQNGYRAISLGKIFHGNLLDPESWSEPEYLADRKSIYALPENIALNRPRKKGPPVESADVTDDAYRDGQVAQRAVEMLRGMNGEPFFLAVGFHKPHLPFAAPKRYWDLYAPDTIALAPNPDPPAGAPPFAIHPWIELRRYLGVPSEGPLDERTARELIHGYLACVSYVDAQVGKVLAELERLELARDTIVVLWSDHGWYLGEHGMWAKMGNFEEALRAPVILRAPGARAGAASRGLVELVDLYPTLCELTGLTPPPHLEGTSFAPLLAEPDRPWKRAVFSQHPASLDIMGYSVRTDRWRFTSWRRASDGAELARELYDHDADPFENVNLAEREDYAATVAGLGSQLDGGWRAAVPR
ncbi:MAG: iduronate sulfatase [Planctomycetota bacterium]|nr:MAG: iduronate sulfatase [Planctomycetota bacterium]